MIYVLLPLMFLIGMVSGVVLALFAIVVKKIDESTLEVGFKNPLARKRKPQAPTVVDDRHSWVVESKEGFSGEDLVD